MDKARRFERVQWPTVSICFVGRLENMGTTEKEQKTSQVCRTGSSQTGLTGSDISTLIYTRTYQVGLTTSHKKQSDRPDTINTITRVLTNNDEVM